MQIKCPKCEVITAAEGVDLVYTQFGCPACRYLLDYSEKPGGLVREKFYDPVNHPDLKVGMKATFDGIEYTVTGVLVKQVQTYYYWREYILTAAAEPQIYLSETDGHWIILKVSDAVYEYKNYPLTFDHEGMSLALYEYEKPNTVLAEGFFDYNVIPKVQKMVEYINPPYIFSVEQIEDTRTTYFGEHISPAAIKKAFGIKSLRSRSGVGIVQPFAINLRDMAMVFCVAAALMIVTHMVVYNSRQNVRVLNQTINFNEYIDRDYVSPAFTLEGGSAPMTIRLHSEVNNSWAAVQVALVNKESNEAEIAVKDIEYYHGYTEGENWTEGSTTETFNICGVSAGRYHLVISPQKAPYDTENNKVDILVYWDQPTAWNLGIPLVSMLVLFFAAFLLRAHFNQKRWADSSYSPYNKNE